MNSISPSFRPPSAFFAVLCLPDYAVQAGVLCDAGFQDLRKSSIAGNAENRKERRERSYTDKPTTNTIIE